MCAMPDTKNFAIEFKSWKEMKEEITKVSPILQEILEALDLNDNLQFIEASYPYGAMIVKDGVVQIPTKDDQEIPLTDSRIPPGLRNLLNYSAIPIGLLLNKESEVFVHTGKRIIPLNMMQPGELFGLFETLSMLSSASSTPLWNVCAGAQSSMMAPKITDSVSHHRLKNELGITSDVPQNFSEHCALFAQIDQAQPKNKRFYSRVLFLTTPFFKESRSNLMWLKLDNYLFKQGWKNVQFSCNDTILNLLWESLANAMNQRRLKPRPYLVDTVKHLIAIGIGGFPGFRAADVSESAVPSRSVQEAYLNIYGLKEYVPLIMYPHILRGEASHIPVYYFLSYPTLFAGSPNKRGTPSMLMDMRDIRTTLQTFEERLGREARDIHPAVLDLLKNIEYAYFNTEAEKFGNIKSNIDMPKLDAHLEIDNDIFGSNKTFPSTSLLFTNCVRVSMKDHNSKKR